MPSLIIARIKGSNTLVGGFNPFGYSSVDDYRSSIRAFLFRQEAAGKEIQFSRPLSADGAIYDFGTYGPIFGTEALVIPLNPSKLKPTCRATSILGNDYGALKGSTAGGTGISARRDGTTSTLFGSKNTVDLSVSTFFFTSIHFIFSHLLRKMMQKIIHHISYNLNNIITTNRNWKFM